ncbi:MAG: diaminopimelate decarboxylase [Geminocystis sp.]|nr:diaminopimelate decarboxylase [Geminocystis sp.]HIK36605.1 diaminopimelate decarboxylase [Geminocystis sp. M7585_C2015_104]MCS7147939.1 diaminopimelate decarboxylase [Geminocystis sp.]MCX8078766.1 diaminopimelate decarboxylase [Geminocystis sp.]MDW8116866.1 diaminopimelate decarboxylase [Geminocystis sp.]
MLLTETINGKALISLFDSQSPNQRLFPLTATVNEYGHLVIGGCDVVDLVKQYGTPLYVLDEYTLRVAARLYRSAFQKYYPGESQVIYASKAWCCQAIVSILAGEGLGFDVVSGGELYTTVKAIELAGYNLEEIGSKIYFHGNNKSKGELEFALDVGCKIIVDNWWELETLAQLAAEKQQYANILLRLTPGIECHTHEYIRTGSIDSKFGFDLSQLEAVYTFVKEQRYLNPIGLHAHIGSQIFQLQPHQDLADILAQWYQKALDYGLSMREVNVGGGLGIRYTSADNPPSIPQWVEAVSASVASAFKARGLFLPKLIAEPGRSIIANACVTAYTVGAKKVIPDVRTYIAVDGGMSDNPRPITYQSLYQMVIANKMNEAHSETVTVAGKHCESGDILIKDISLPPTNPGDILVVLATGAYNYSMASNYNRIGRPAAVLVNEGESHLIIRRETYEDLIQQDLLPTRLFNNHHQ